MSKGRSTSEIYECIQNPATTGNPQLTTTCLTIVQSYNGLEKVTYNLHLWLLHHPMVMWLQFKSLATGLHLRLIACDCDLQLFFANFQQKVPIEEDGFFNDMISLMTMVIRLITAIKIVVKLGPTQQMQWLTTEIPVPIVDISQGVLVTPYSHYCILKLEFKYSLYVHLVMEWLTEFM